MQSFVFNDSGWWWLMWILIYFIRLIARHSKARHEDTEAHRSKVVNMAIFFDTLAVSRGLTCKQQSSRLMVYRNSYMMKQHCESNKGNVFQHKQGHLLFISNEMLFYLTRRDLLNILRLFNKDRFSNLKNSKIRHIWIQFEIIHVTCSLSLYMVFLLNYKTRQLLYKPMIGSPTIFADNKQ